MHLEDRRMTQRLYAPDDAADAGIPLDVRRSLLGHEHRDITLHYSAPDWCGYWRKPSES